MLISMISASRSSRVKISEIKKHKKMVRELEGRRPRRANLFEDDVDEAQKAIRSALLKIAYERRSRRTAKDKLRDVSGAFECASLIENEEYGSRAFSVQEFKGLERDAVVLVDFFGSAETRR